MSQSFSDDSIWTSLVLNHKAYIQSLKEFLAKDVDHVPVIRKALRSPERDTALHAAGFIENGELIQLFPDLIDLASTMHRSIDAVRALILKLPREYVVEHIEEAVEPLITKNDSGYDEYRRFLELYFKIDRGLTQKLAQRATQHEDEDVREAGFDFLGKLEASESNTK